MGKIDSLGRQIAALSTEELATFRRWLARFDARAWDRQFETDTKADRLDGLADKVLRAHAEGRTTKL